MFAFTIGSRSKDIERQDYTLKLNVQRANTWRCKHRMQTMLMHSSKKRVQQSKQRTVKQALRTLRTRPLLLLQPAAATAALFQRRSLQAAESAGGRSAPTAASATSNARLLARLTQFGREGKRQGAACLPASLLAAKKSEQLNRQRASASFLALKAAPQDGG